ncbi:hypothetical protein ACE6H2_026230 [Prunus campanulata]
MITSNSTLIRRGGFGEACHGSVENNTRVVVKILNLSSKQGSKEFQNEVKLLMRVHHRNLVSFIGYYDEDPAVHLAQNDTLLSSSALLSGRFSIGVVQRSANKLDLLFGRDKAGLSRGLFLLQGYE